MNNHEPRPKHGNTKKIKRGLGITGAAAAVALAAGLSMSGTEGDVPVPERTTTTTSAPERTTTTTTGVESKPFGELDPKQEAAKQVIGNDMERLFKIAYEGDIRADEVERGSTEPVSEGAPRLYTVTAKIDGRIVRMHMSATGDTLNPDYTSTVDMGIAIIEPGAGETSSDNPEGDKYLAQVTWFAPYIQGQVGREDLKGTDFDGRTFSTQVGNIGGEMPGVLGGGDAINTANQVVSDAARLLTSQNTV